ncbi:MAG: hypothetical protein R8K20_07075 [Gallionellaceae bacterium]
MFTRQRTPQASTRSKRLTTPFDVTQDWLPDCYKIYITTPQYRLIYHVTEEKLLLTMLSVATRDDVYAELRMRMGAWVQ